MPLRKHSLAKGPKAYQRGERVKTRRGRRGISQAARPKGGRLGIPSPRSRALARERSEGLDARGVVPPTLPSGKKKPARRPVKTPREGSLPVRAETRTSRGSVSGLKAASRARPGFSRGTPRPSHGQESYLVAIRYTIKENKEGRRRFTPAKIMVL